MAEAKQEKNNEFHVVDQKHEINKELVSIIQFRQNKKWYISIAVVALFRPGPMENIPSFCNRKHGREKIEYLHPLLEKILKDLNGPLEKIKKLEDFINKYITKP